MKEIKNEIFTEWKEVEGFVGAGLTEDNIVMYWETDVYDNAPNEKDGYKIEHEVIGKITLQNN